MGEVIKHVKIERVNSDDILIELHKFRLDGWELLECFTNYISERDSFCTKCTLTRKN